MTTSSEPIDQEPVPGDSQPAPEVVEVLDRRLSALEVEIFILVEKVRQVGNATDRTANTLDEVEGVLAELSLAAADHTDAAQGAPADVVPAGLTVDIEAAMQLRQAHLDTDPAPPVPNSTDMSGQARGRPTSGGGQTAEVALPDLDTLHAWVDIQVAPRVRKTTTTGEGGGVRWCRQWWHHQEAVERFTALFLTHGQLSASGEPTWLSVYLRDHVDPHLATLTSPYGPFYACSPRKHSSAIEPLGHDLLTENTAAQTAVPTGQVAMLAAGSVVGTVRHPGG